MDSISFPLLMRWNGETLPTLHFRLALARLGLAGKDVKVRLGKDITYTQNGATYEARAVDIDENGGLVVLHTDGTRLTLQSGEISLRLA